MQVETVDINDLKEHPKNYKKHPDDQLKHIISSIEEHGFYRNIVIAVKSLATAGSSTLQNIRVYYSLDNSNFFSNGIKYSKFHSALLGSSKIFFVYIFSKFRF